MTVYNGLSLLKLSDEMQAVAMKQGNRVFFLEGEGPMGWEEVNANTQRFLL
jgi:hypothetical protein